MAKTPIQLRRTRISNRWAAALCLFAFGFAGLLSGVGVSERAHIEEANLLAKAYYSIGLFVFGGLDLGTPSGGPAWGRALLWLAYFGAPALTASAVIEALLRLVSPHRWRLRAMENHVVVLGSGELTQSFLQVLRRHEPEVPVVVIDGGLQSVRQQELMQAFDVDVVVGDITHDFLLRALRLEAAARVVLLGDDTYQCYEAASRILTLYPRLQGRVILHSHNLRFMRAMQATAVGRHCVCFNSYHLAAMGLVRDHLRAHFERTAAPDTVVIAGFGRFGQTILEELHAHAAEDLEVIALIDVDAERRILVAEEQKQLDGAYRREVLQGDISHPEVWRDLAAVVDLSRGQPVVILGTGRTEENLRTALWIQQRHPNALVFARCNQTSEFARRVGADRGIHAISITQLIQDSMPPAWVRIGEGAA